MRVYRLARRDGMSVLIIASIFSLFAAMMGDMGGAMIGVTVAGAGLWSCKDATYSAKASHVACAG